MLVMLVTAGDVVEDSMSGVAVSAKHAAAGSLSVASGVSQLPGVGSACLAPKKKKAMPVLRSPVVSSLDAAATPSRRSRKRRASALDEC